jgi:hypothetical protein
MQTKIICIFTMYMQAARPSLTLKNVPVLKHRKLLLFYIRLFYDHLILKSLGTHFAQTPLISKYSVRILNTENLLSPHVDPTSLNLRLLWWCHEYGISRYPYLTDVFQISQRNIYHKFLLKIVYTTYTPMILTLPNISLIPSSFFGLGWRFHKLNAEITCVF